MKEFVQELQRIVIECGYERRLLVEKFKRGMNEVIRRRLIELEHSPISIKQWYKGMTNLDWH